MTSTKKRYNDDTDIFHIVWSFLSFILFEGIMDTNTPHPLRSFGDQTDSESSEASKTD